MTIKIFVICFVAILHVLYECAGLTQPMPRYEHSPGVACGLYQRLQQRLHSDGRPLKMLYASATDHAAIGWVREAFGEGSTREAGYST